MKFPALIAIVILTVLALLPVPPGILAKVSLAAQQDAGSKATPAEPPIPVALPKGKKLILTDGTFQLAREYTVEGDRVRYWSVERSQWEEIPTKLVDWDATHKAEAEQAGRDAALKAKIHASEVAERTRDINVDRSLEIKPALFLPDGVGFYALDANKLIIQMKQSEAVTKSDTSRVVERIITGVPLIPTKQTIEIPGERAAVRLKSAEPEFFMRPADEREPRFRLLRAQVKGGHRVLEDVSTYYSGQQAQKATDIEIQTWTPATGVFRYTLDQRLEPGEYAFVEMTGEGISSYVWDFGVDPPGTKSQK
jgi:hypothetical protein